MNNSRSSTLLYSLGAVLLIGLFFWSSLFRFVLPKPPTTDIRSGYTDKLSGQFITTQQINNVTHTNPRAPYFVAFEKLDYYGVSSDDKRYIQDLIINYILYKKQLDAPIVSLVDKSFKGPYVESEGYVTKYSFQFGIDGQDIHTVSVISDSRDSSIDITITQGVVTKDHRKFVLYYYN